MLIGADNWPVEVAPNPIRSSRCPSTRSCWWSTASTCSENLKLDELVAKQVYEFAFVMQPIKVQGFTGSTVAPSRSLTTQGQVLHSDKRTM